MQVANSRHESVLASKEPGDGEDIAVGRNGGNLKNIRQGKLGRAVIGVLVKEFIKYLACFRPELVEKVLLLGAKTLCTLAPCAERCVERQMTQEIQRISVWLVGDGSQVLEGDAPLLKLLEDRLSLNRIGPFRAQFYRVAVQAPDLFRSQ